MKPLNPNLCYFKNQAIIKLRFPLERVISNQVTFYSDCHNTVDKIALIAPSLWTVSGPKPVLVPAAPAAAVTLQPTVRLTSGTRVHPIDLFPCWHNHSADWWYWLCDESLRKPKEATHSRHKEAIGRNGFSSENNWIVNGFTVQADILVSLAFTGLDPHV